MLSYFSKTYFSIVFLPSDKFCDLAAKLLWPSSASYNDKYPSCICLIKKIDKELSLKF